MLPTIGRCFLLGAVLGTLLDGIHAYGDVLVYPDPAFGRWAWFVPVEFGLTGAAVGLLMPAMEQWVAGGDTPRWSPAQRAGELALFAALYAATALIEPGGAAVLAIALAALAVLRLALGGVRGDWAYALAAAVLGPAAEAVISALGAFDYADPDFAGVPIWLPSLWANGGLLIRRLIAPIALTARSRAALQTGVQQQENSNEEGTGVGVL
jgi:membrane-associated protease RseP (regulator of RpoE activity)